MKMIRTNGILFLYVVVCLSIISCKNENKSENSTTMPAFALLNQSDLLGPEIDTYKQNAQKEVDNLISAKGEKVPTIIEDKMWLLEAIVKDTSFIMKERLNGNWIDFDTNWRFTYGANEKELGLGKFYYDFENQLITLVYNDKGLKPQKFKVINIASDMSVMQGEPDYKDNNMQFKLARIASKPTQTTSNPK